MVGIGRLWRKVGVSSAVEQGKVVGFAYLGILLVYGIFEMMIGQ